MHRKAKAHAYASFQRLVAIVLRLEEAGIRWQVYNHYNIIKFKAVVTKKTQDGVLRLMGISIDTLIYGQQDERAKGSINDNELLTMFAKVQLLSNKQQDTVKDFLSAFVLKTDLQKNLAAK